VESVNTTLSTSHTGRRGKEGEGEQDEGGERAKDEKRAKGREDKGGKNRQYVVISTKFSYFGGFVRFGVSPLLPIWAKFGVKQLTYVPNYIQIRLLCRLPGTKKTAIGQFLTFTWLIYPAPFPDEGQIWRAAKAQQTHGLRLSAKFRLDRFILSPSSGKTPKFCRFLDFGILWCRHLVAI